MGYMRHHAIVVTSFDKKRALKALSMAESFGLNCSEAIESTSNSYLSFFVAPDGSKEGRPESEHGDAKRELFIKWLNDYRYSDGSTPLDWAEVQYGDEEGDQKVIRADSDIRSSDDYNGATLAED